MTLVLTTHDMNEAAELADRVGIMDHGRLLALDTPGGADALAAAAGRRSSCAADGAADGAVARGARGARRRRARRAGVAGASPGRPRRTALRLRLYVAGDAPLLVAPAAAVLAERGLALDDVTLGSADASRTSSST